MLNGIFKKRACGYSIISNDAIDNMSLSPSAYYIYSKICRYITLMDNSDFVLTKDFVYSKSNMGKKTFDKYWKELCLEGYLKIYQVPDRDNKGQFLTQYELKEIHEVDTPYFIMYKADGTIAKQLFPIPKAKEKEEKDYKKSYGNVKEKVENTVGSKIGGTVVEYDGKMEELIITDKLNTNEINTDISSSTKEEEDNLPKELVKRCISNDIKISYKQIEKLLDLYDNMKVIKAIEKMIIASEDTEIKRPYNYIAKIIENAEKQVVTNITIENNKKQSFNNFTQREKTAEEYAELEKKLLGWDD